MDVPVNFLFFGELAILGRKQQVRYPGRKDNIDEGVGQKRSHNFVDMEWQRGEPQVVGERLDCLAKPWYRWDDKRILHCCEDRYIGERIRCALQLERC